MPRRAGMLVLVLSVFGVASRAEQGGGVTGGWAAVKDAPPGLAAAPSPVLGARFWLREEGQSLTVIRPARDTAVAATHTIDGPDVRTRVPGAMCLGDSAIITRVSREGAALVHTLVASVPAGSTAPVPSGLRHVFRRQDAGTLIVESTMRQPGRAEPVAVGTVYRRMDDAAPAISAPPAGLAPATLERVAWVSGTWAGAVGAAAVEERWTPASGGTMLATSRTTRGGAVAEFEFLCIAERHGSLVYAAMPNGRAPATEFFLTAVDDSSATFENPAHDFPKRIRYALRPDGSLEATIGGDASQRAITYTFKQIDR